jgi:hypothetical protein
VDFNDDGILDLAVGERYDHFNFFTGNGDGTFTFLGYPWDDGGSPIERGYNTSPWLTDWNEDGYIDFVAGGHNTETTTAGILEVHLNTSDDHTSPVWSASTIDLTPLCNLWRLTQETFDLDGDGDKDLILGYEMGNVWFAENVGTNDDPQFSGYVQLNCDGGPINVYTTYGGGGRAREHVTDLNGDGIPDLLVGCSNGWVYYFEGYIGTGVSGGAAGAEEFGLCICGNPTGGPFTVSLSLPAVSVVSLEVVDASGRMVRSFRGSFAAGDETVRMDVSDLPAGMYMVRAEAGGDVRTAKLIRID